MKALFDSDVLIDYLQREVRAKLEIEKYIHREISIVSWIEVMTRAITAEEKEVMSEFLLQFKQHLLTPDIAARAVELRQKYKLKTPDATIWATAQIHDCLLVTRNARDFPANDPGIRYPYKLK